jgi:hypothetical protein
MFCHLLALLVQPFSFCLPHLHQRFFLLKFLLFPYYETPLFIALTSSLTPEIDHGVWFSTPLNTQILRQHYLHGTTAGPKRNSCSVRDPETVASKGDVAIASRAVRSQSQREAATQAAARAADVAVAASERRRQKKTAAAEASEKRAAGSAAFAGDVADAGILNFYAFAQSASVALDSWVGRPLPAKSFDRRVCEEQLHGDLLSTTFQIFQDEPGYFNEGGFEVFGAGLTTCTDGWLVGGGVVVGGDLLSIDGETLALKGTLVPNEFCCKLREMIPEGFTYPHYAVYSLTRSLVELDSATSLGTSAIITSDIFPRNRSARKAKDASGVSESDEDGDGQ